MGTTGPFPKAVVVVADDDRATCERISRLLRTLGATVVPTHNGQKAIDAVRAQSVDLVVLDVNMPGLNGVDACKVIKTITRDRFVPVMLLTSSGQAGGRILGTRSSADDHLPKPFSDDDLVARVENMLRVKRAHDDVQFAKNEMRYTSLHDQLRTLPDYHFFHHCLEEEFDEAQRHLDPLACCIVAVDDFRKLVSDSGADVAAQILDETFERLQRTIRATDIAAQFRTAEFGLLLRNTRPARALTLADRLMSEVALRPFKVGNACIELTIAIGVGLFPSGRIRSHSELLDAASIAVARARVAGANRVCVVQQQGYIFRPTLPGAA
ncbi:MAG: response regulator [Polyangiales bacterium]